MVSFFLFERITSICFAQLKQWECIIFMHTFMNADMLVFIHESNQFIHIEIDTYWINKKKTIIFQLHHYHYDYYYFFFIRIGGIISFICLLFFLSFTSNIYQILSKWICFFLFLLSFDFTIKLNMLMILSCHNIQ